MESLRSSACILGNHEPQLVGVVGGGARRERNKEDQRCGQPEEDTMQRGYPFGSLSGVHRVTAPVSRSYSPWRRRRASRAVTSASSSVRPCLR